MITREEREARCDRIFGHFNEAMTEARKDGRITEMEMVEEWDVKNVRTTALFVVTRILEGERDFDKVPWQYGLWQKCFLRIGDDRVMTVPANFTGTIKFPDGLIEEWENGKRKQSNASFPASQITFTNPSLAQPAATGCPITPPSLTVTLPNDDLPQPEIVEANR